MTNWHNFVKMGLYLEISLSSLSINRKRKKMFVALSSNEIIPSFYLKKVFFLVFYYGMYSIPK